MVFLAIACVFERLVRREAGGEVLEQCPSAPGAAIPRLVAAEGA